MAPEPQQAATLGTRAQINTSGPAGGAEETLLQPDLTEAPQPEQPWRARRGEARVRCASGAPRRVLSPGRQRLIWKTVTATPPPGRGWHPGQENVTHLRPLPSSRGTPGSYQELLGLWLPALTMLSGRIEPPFLHFAEAQTKALPPSSQPHPQCLGPGPGTPAGPPPLSSLFFCALWGPIKPNFVTSLGAGTRRFPRASHGGGVGDG